MKIKLLVCLTALLAVAATNEVVKQFEPLKAKLTVKVLDESGQPFPNVDVQIGFEDPTTRRNVYVKGKTDTDGLFSGEGVCDGIMAGGIQKDGYYWSGFPFKITGTEDNHWLPWNPTCVTVLRPIGKPIALYARKVRTDIPILGKPCGYDLEAADWVTPYGKGLKKDLVFTIQTKEVKGAGVFDAQGELTFADSFDGLQDANPVTMYSVFKWERLAPEIGYNSKLKLQNTWWENLGQKPIRSFKNMDKEWEGYFFRVRTVEQDGKIVSAHYGKIRGGIEIEPRETPTCTIAFTYYFNPTPNDRNLEWDTTKNVFGNLPFLETPRDP